MKLYSYNVNGIRAAISKGLNEWLLHEQPDIICLQEIKATPDQFDVHSFETLYYTSLWNPAERKGYSGVALLSKIKPKRFSFGMNKQEFDIEGRVIVSEFETFTHVCVYVPSGSMGDQRQTFKMQFLDAFYTFIEQLLQKHPYLIVSGDFNICHKPIDINHPEKHEHVSGFLPEEREWMDKFVELGFIDSFRKFNQQPNQYSWWSYRQRAREKNLGWRIDYHFISTPLDDAIVDAQIHADVFHSDHCPVSVTIKN
ncbi:MAG: exodeoxyribonuclease III [Bacteroidales bacterium]|nr:exodeoxyribonuclease III [Bacteroidales bacterium]